MNKMTLNQRVFVAFLSVRKPLVVFGHFRLKMFTFRIFKFLYFIRIAHNLFNFVAFLHTKSGHYLKSSYLNVLKNKVKLQSKMITLGNEWEN